MEKFNIKIFFIAFAITACKANNTIEHAKLPPACRTTNTNVLNTFSPPKKAIDGLDWFGNAFFSLLSTVTKDTYKEDYLKSWKSIQIQKEHLTELEFSVDKIKQNKIKYEEVSQTTHIPWWFIGILHGLESAYSFDKHLHNGDSLLARTIHVPAGKPSSGQPPFTWEESAKDALTTNIDMSINWADIAHIAYTFESYNGFGYRNRGINSPYLWSYSNQYSKGKYVSDGKYDANTISKQAGAMSILKLLIDENDISTTDSVTITINTDPLDNAQIGQNTDSKKNGASANNSTAKNANRLPLCP